ncbi:MscL family protein [Streptomyces sp. H27-G5]|uniref:MscL family protein n=1 Tax=Streptomyces sp. H27-G5 TaxID=2996698 RepID=UPI00226F2C09|nr:MscL family protein [Streptomyces sp. H27-G5]MCY0924065.1 MscL family protein [Streptomyces sp. H27-G5]
MSRKAFTIGTTEFPYGAFINPVISFLLLATALYFLLVLPINKRLAPHQDVQAPRRDCPECPTPAPAQARRCAVPLPALPAQAETETQRVG